MNNELILEGEKYISSKRASESSGYSQDYIGQLARKGLVEAQRIGGLWYISEGSLNTYKKDAESFKPEPPNQKSRASEPDAIVSFDGREYVSAAKAAGITGYHQDYVGQLAREGIVLSRQIGTRWYVDREALMRHKKQKDALLAAVQVEAVGIRPSKPSALERNDVGYSGGGPYMTYTRDEQDLLPTISSSSIRESVSGMDEEPRSARDLSVHAIPIRKIDQQRDNYNSNNSMRSRSSGVPETRQRRRGKLHLRSALVPAAVATIVIVIVAGYVSFQSNAIYTQASPASGLALALRVADVLSKIGDVIEDFVSPEIRYSRPR